MFSLHSSPSSDELAEELRQQLATLQSCSDHIQQSLTALRQQPKAPASVSTHDAQSDEPHDEPQEAVQPPGQEQSEHDGAEGYPTENTDAKPQPAQETPAASTAARELEETVPQEHEPSQSAEPPECHAEDSAQIPNTQEAQTPTALHSATENNADDTNPLTYNVPSAALIQDLPSCHLLTSAHTPDTSLHRINLSASQHSSYGTNSACLSPARNTHASTHEPIPYRQDSANPSAAYAIDPTTAREAGEHAEGSEEAVQPPGQEQSEHGGAEGYPTENTDAKPQPAQETPAASTAARELEETVPQEHEPSQSAEPPECHAEDSAQIPNTQEAQTPTALHSATENNADDTNPLTYNVPSAALIQDLPSCHLLTSAHTPDTSLHRINLSASQHSSYGTNSACLSPARNTHASTHEPIPYRQDSANPSAAYAIDPTTAREAGEHAEGSEEAVQPPGQEQSEHDGAEGYPTENTDAKPQPAQETPAASTAARELEETVPQEHEPSQSAEPPECHAEDSAQIPNTQEAQTPTALHSATENNADDTNPLTYNVPSAALIQDLPSCHLLTSAHTPDTSLHRINLSASQHSSYGTNSACLSPARNTHASTHEPIPYRQDSANPSAAYAIDPTTAREAGEHAEGSEEAVQPPGQEQSEHDGAEGYPTENTDAKPQPAQETPAASTAARELEETVPQEHEPSQSSEPPECHAEDSAQIPNTQEAQTPTALHSATENNADDTNPLTYNVPSAALIQDLPSCHLLTSAHTPDTSLHRINLSASQHSSYGTNSACLSPARNTHASTHEPIPYRQDSANPSAAYAIDPTAAREAGEHAEGSEEAVQPPGQEQSEHDGAEGYPTENTDAKPQPAQETPAASTAARELEETVPQEHEPSQSSEPPECHAEDSAQIPNTQEAQTPTALHSATENNADDTNPLTYNVPSAALIQDLPSCHLLTSAHTPDTSLHRINLSASQHSSYGTNSACLSPARNTHASTHEPIPYRQDSANPSAAYAIDPTAAREAGEHADPRRSDNEAGDVHFNLEREDAVGRAAASQAIVAEGVGGLPLSASLPRMLDCHEVSGAQRRLSDCGAVKRGVSSMPEVGSHLRGGENHTGVSDLVPPTRSPPSQQQGYLSLYASKKSELENAKEPERTLVEQASGVDGELALFVSSSLLPVSRCLLQVKPLTPREQGHDGTCVTPAMSVAAAAYASSVATSSRAGDEAVALTSTAPARFELSSAANGDVVERDILAGRPYWDAENPKTTSYRKPSALLEAKEKRECTLFRRYSRRYKKLVEDSAVHVGGEAGASILRSHEAFKVACEAADQKPIHKRSFYEGPSVNWKKVLLEQAAGMSSVSNGAA
ncbi:hypothetical protein conserved [Leishmania donovani]|uniref:Hypothetical_protein_conserved n=1 Tax=Leishmania donovani TaxID=5661 RepID=A0A6J8FEL4_LEIDO|nr:hypothetical protein conserved [Leishmania donovani]VDZ45294.1 hypothetical_protein_conserved [Leishmania donovani]